MLQFAGPRRPLEASEALDRVVREHARAAILVEGWSDEAAVVAWARSCAVDLAGCGIAVLPVGGITNMGKFVSALSAPGLAVRLCGLYDASEEFQTLRILERAGLGANLTREGVEAAGFFACISDLEDELIRAMGPLAVEQLLEAQDELRSFRRFQAQPAQQGRDTHGQLKRFIGTRAGRKIRYGSLLVHALAREQVPAPLRCVLAYAMISAASTESAPEANPCC
jgi:hypothetical protein